MIDSRIGVQSTNWSLGRMTRVDLNILRLATYELLFRSDIPRNVTMNEAIEVAKKYGSEESPAFINGILDEIAATVPENE
jgi:N utilization substance protein B